MAKAARHKRGGRTTPKGTQPPGSRGRGAHQHDRGLQEQAARAVRTRSPIDVLTLASGVVELCTPRPLDPEDDDERPDLLDVVHSFVHATPELASVAAVIGELTADGELADHIRGDLAEVRLPARVRSWISTMALAEPTEARLMSHPHRDGDDIIIGVRWPSGEEISAIVYIDHNIGSVVKDAFLLPDGPSGVAVRFKSMSAPHVTITPMSPADARAQIAWAIEHGERTPDMEPTESWPTVRSVVEWMIAKLPTDGTAYSKEPIDDAETNTLVDRFIASPFATELDLPPDAIREICDPVVWYAHDQAGGDPLRVSPVLIEALLFDWLAYKVHLQEIHRLVVPMVLKAWARFAGEARGLPAELIDESIEAIDQWAPDYLQAVSD
jgi:hypothetical protein